MAFAAIDPGGKTGVALTPSLAYREMRDNFKVHEVPCSQKDPLPGCQQVVQLLREVDGYFGLQVIIMEDFILQEFTMTRDLLMPVRVAAMIEALARPMFPECEFIYRMPNQRRICTRERMTRWKLWTPGMKDANAAMQHLASYAREHA